MILNHAIASFSNALAESMLLKQREETLTKMAYKRRRERLQDWLLKHRSPCTQAEEQLGVPILKLIDEGIYLMCTVYGELPQMAANQLGL